MFLPSNGNYPPALASAYLYPVHFLFKTFQRKIRLLQTRRRTSNLSITISDAGGSGKLGKIRVLKTGSRTYDLLITSSNADSGKLRKIRVLETRSRLLVRILTRGKLKKIRVLKSSRAKPLTFRFLVRMLDHYNLLETSRSKTAELRSCDSNM